MVSAVETDGQVFLNQSWFSDSECTASVGDVVGTRVVNQCIGVQAQPEPSYAYKYLDLLEELIAPETSTVSGLATRGYQLYNSCVANIKISFESIAPNDYCYASSGTTSGRTKYEAYSYFCSGSILTQTFYSDALCATVIDDATTVSRLGQVENTCFTNKAAEYDYNLFETLSCVGVPSTAPRPSTTATATKTIVADQRYAKLVLALPKQ